MLNPLKQIPTRDTALHSGAEMQRRLGQVGFWASLALAVGLGVAGFAQGAAGKLLIAAACALVFLGLWVTRTKWTRRSDGPAPSAGSSPSPTEPLSLAATVGSRPSVETATGHRRPRVLLLNASLAGAAGNSSRLLARVRRTIEHQADVDEVALAGPGALTFAGLERRLRAADALVVATGTHWDSWSSPLQRFLEEATEAEATTLWLGKPVAVLVSEHSTGGKGVLSRLQGVLVTLGCAIPPLSGLVVAQSSQLARRHAPSEAEDFWGIDDVDVVAENLLLAARLPAVAWRTWPVDRNDFTRVWVE